MTETEALIGDIIAEVARQRGVALSRDDPILEVVWLNQAVLRRYLEQTLVPTVTAIQEARDQAIQTVEHAALAQRERWEQAEREHRTAFLEAQQALHEAWKADMQQLIDGQNAALKQVVMETAQRLRESPPTPTTAPRSSRRWRGVMAGVVLAIAAFAVATVLWR